MSDEPKTLEPIIEGDDEVIEPNNKESEDSLPIEAALEILKWCVKHTKTFHGGFYIDVDGVQVIESSVLIERSDSDDTEKEPEDV